MSQALRWSKSWGAIDTATGRCRFQFAICIDCAYDEDDNEVLVDFARYKFPDANLKFFARNVKGTRKLFSVVDAAVEAKQCRKWGLCKVMVGRNGDVISVRPSRDRHATVRKYLVQPLGEPPQPGTPGDVTSGDSKSLDGDSCDTATTRSKHITAGGTCGVGGGCNPGAGASAGSGASAGQ